MKCLIQEDMRSSLSSYHFILSRIHLNHFFCLDNALKLTPKGGFYAFFMPTIEPSNRRLLRNISKDHKSWQTVGFAIPLQTVWKTIV